MNLHVLQEGSIELDEQREMPLVDGDVEEVGDLSLESMEDEEVATVDRVFEGAFGALGDTTWHRNESFSGCHGEDIQCAGSDTRPPMLDKTDFASWQQRIRLYCRGPERPRVYSDLSQDEKDRYNADIRATNIILQGLPKDIYLLINSFTDAKGHMGQCEDAFVIGSELTKEDRESQLYDDFEHFRQNKGETIHDYYVRFAKLINDMRNIKMTMSKIQLNSKFVNNMLPEWGRFVTAVKLNKGLKDSNFDQLYAYLKAKLEANANENR
ncbi:hypothetical protein Tco_0715644 [Tanacetum coccineum]